MEAAGFFETMIPKNKITQRHILDTHHPENNSGNILNCECRKNNSCWSLIKAFSTELSPS
jgi:hypothetical protein